MKKHSTLVWVIAAALVGALITACGKSGGGGSVDSTPAPAVVPYGPVNVQQGRTRHLIKSITMVDPLTCFNRE